MTESRCLTCGLPLPCGCQGGTCTEHPSPPKLSFVGGTHFEPNPEYRRTEKPPKAAVSSDTDGATPGCDDAGWPERDSPVAAGASNGSGAKRDNLPERVHRELPLPANVADASRRLEAGKGSLEYVLETVRRTNPESVLVLMETDRGFSYVENGLDIALSNWLCDCMKHAVLSAAVDGEEPA
jgi:hypothetical protein